MPTSRHIPIMTAVLDVICTSVSVSRPLWVRPDELLAAIKAPDRSDPAKASIAEALLSEISLTRLSEMVRSGAASWREIAEAAGVYDLAGSDAGQLAAEMTALGV